MKKFLVDIILLCVKLGKGWFLGRVGFWEGYQVNTVIYHTDADGYCSAAIVYKYLVENNRDPVQLIPFNYGDQLPWWPILNSEEVFIVDCSVTPEEFGLLVSEGLM